MSRKNSVELFGDRMLQHHVSLIFGGGIFAVRGVVISVHQDFLVVQEEGKLGERAMLHVPLDSIVYAKLGAKAEA